MVALLAAGWLSSVSDTVLREDELLELEGVAAAAVGVAKEVGLVDCVVRGMVFDAVANNDVMLVGGACVLAG